MKSRTLLIALVIAAAVLHLSILTFDFPTLAKNGFLYDDAFYAFQVARNVAVGHGATFDGVHPTNGFQPLYVLLLVPLYAATGGDPIIPIYLALGLLALCTVITSVFLYRILARYVREKVALACAALWIFSPVVMRQAGNGLETALSMLLIAIIVFYYIDRIRSRPVASRVAFVKLGVLIGLGMLARVDEVFLALAIALDYLLLMRRRDVATTPGTVLAGAAAAFVVYLPWTAWGIYAVGSPLQESGAATRFLSLAYAQQFGMSPKNLMVDGPTPGFVWAHAVHAASVLKLVPFVHVFFRGIQKLSESAPGATASTVAAIANAAGIATLVMMVVYLLRRMRRAGSRLGELAFLLLYAVMLCAAYVFWVYGVFFFLRYLYPVYFVAMIFFGFVLEDIIGRLNRRPVVLKRAGVGIAAAYTVCMLFMTGTTAFRTSAIYPFYEVARWAAQNTSPDDVIGSFQSGTIGYLSGRRVVNLDGKVNSEARAALKRGDLIDYVDNAGIDIVIDHAPVVKEFLGPWSGDGFERLWRNSPLVGRKLGASGWMAFRVSGASDRNPASMRASGTAAGTPQGSLPPPW